MRERLASFRFDGRLNRDEGESERVILEWSKTDP